MSQYYYTIEREIRDNRLKTKIKNELVNFAIESIKPIKNKAVSNRVVPKIYDKEKTEVLYNAWQKDFEIDGFKGYFSITLKSEKKWDGTTRKSLHIYAHGYNEKRNAYAPDISEYINDWTNGDGAETWDGFLADLERNGNKQIPTDAEIDAFLKHCEDIKAKYLEWEKKREAFRDFYGNYTNERVSLWNVRG